MARVIGIDPGTVSVDVCGLDAGQLFLDRSLPTLEVGKNPSALIDLLERAHEQAAVTLIAGPSGYGLPLIEAKDLTDAQIRLAFLPGQHGSEPEVQAIQGLSTIVKALGRFPAPVVLTPGVVHLPTVPSHRKVNRVDMGTADKVCAAALAIYERAEQLGCSYSEVSFIMLELGGGFSAAVAVDGGAIVDGLGGTSGPLGIRAAGALDGEVAFLAGTVTKELLFQGGVESIAGTEESSVEAMFSSPGPRSRLAREAYLESATKATASLAVSVPDVTDVILSGRVAGLPSVRDELTRRLIAALPGARVWPLSGFATTAKHAAQGAALIADGLSGGPSAGLVDAMGIKLARGTVLDYLYVISQEAARRRIGID